MQVCTYFIVEQYKWKYCLILVTMIDVDNTYDTET